MYRDHVSLRQHSSVFCPKKNIEGETVWTGSARSVDAFHILNAIDTCKEYLVTYGGHKLAAGLTIKADKGMLEHFREAINKEAARQEIVQDILLEINIGNEESLIHTTKEGKK